MPSKKNYLSLFIIIVVALMIVGAMVYYVQPQNDEADPLSYSLNNESISVSKNTGSFDYTVEQLKGRASECGSEHEDGYFENLIARFDDVSKTIYSFQYAEDSQEPDSFNVTLLPNKAGYALLDEFKKDFDICAAGGQDYPHMLNENWLMFTSSCGSGFDDGSGRPNGCEEARKAVEESLELN